VTVFIYSGNEEMGNGLRQLLGFSDLEVAAATRVGITEQIAYTLHLHAKTKNWGALLTHAIVDEHIHGVIQDRYGLNPSRNATWLEEGMTSYLANRLLASELAGFESTFPTRRFKTAFKALVRGRANTLEEISTREAWYGNIVNSYETWINQYALAYFSVDHLVGQHGIQAAWEALEAVGAGQDVKAAIADATGGSFSGFERDMRRSLLRTGFVELYPHYTVILILLAFIACVAAIAFFIGRGEEQRSRPASPGTAQ
jgi:hypothetical protein